MSTSPFIKLPNGEMIRSDLIICVRVEDQIKHFVNDVLLYTERPHVAVDIHPKSTVPKSTYLHFDTIQERDAARQQIEDSLELASEIIIDGGNPK